MARPYLSLADSQLLAATQEHRLIIIDSLRRFMQGREENSATAQFPRHIPHELCMRPQWVLWRLEDRDEQPKKIPYKPRNPDQQASTTDMSTWATFGEAVQAYEDHQFSGIGFVFTQDDFFVGVDLDHCRDGDTGILKPWAQDIIKALNSYTEVSQSGAGIHIFVRGVLTVKRHRKRMGEGKEGVEMYDSGRFFCMTGHHVEGTPLEILARHNELDTLQREIFGTTKALTQHGHARVHHAVNLSDHELLQKARNARNGTKFRALWSGDWTGYPSQSEADLALCRLLAYWTNDHSEAMDRLFRQSGLYRPKWDALRNGLTYGHQTILKALGLRE